MTSREQVREEIARELKTHRRVRAVNFGRDYACLCGEVLRSNSHHVLAEHQVDALLARWPFLGGVTDEMVEAGARALADWDGADWDRPEPEFDTHEAITKRAYRAGATAVLSAVLGSRDADAPGDRSTT